LVQCCSEIETNIIKVGVSSIPISQEPDSFETHCKILPKLVARQAAWREFARIHNDISSLIDTSPNIPDLNVQIARSWSQMYDQFRKANVPIGIIPELGSAPPTLPILSTGPNDRKNSQQRFRDLFNAWADYAMAELLKIKQSTTFHR